MRKGKREREGDMEQREIVRPLRGMKLKVERKEMSVSHRCNIYGRVLGSFFYVASRCLVIARVVVVVVLGLL